MRIVGIEASGPEVGGIHTIDVWFSQRRAVWIVERLDGDGNSIGAAYLCPDREAAEDCLAHWLREHGEAKLVAPFDAAQRIEAKRAA